MSDHEFINRGDRVRITIEGVHDGTLPNVTGTYGADRDFEVESQHADTITVELVERTVETFKPGDIVQQKGFPDMYRYVVTSDGYVQLSDGRHFRKDSAYMEKYFNSNEMSKVNLAEAPF